MTLKDKCMLCGNPAYLGFIAMECTGIKCKNYSAKLVNETSNIQKEPKTNASYVNVIPPVYPYKFQVGDQVEVIGSNNLNGWTGTIKTRFLSPAGQNAYEVGFNKRGVIPVHETDLNLLATASGAVVVPTPSPHAPGNPPLPFNIGDRVMVSIPVGKAPAGNYNHNGLIGEYKPYNSQDGWVVFGGSTAQYLYPLAWLSLVPAVQKLSSTNKYNIGDRVKVDSLASLNNGKIGSVASLLVGPVGNQLYKVDFDDGTDSIFDESFLIPAPGTLTALQNRTVTPPQVNSATPFKIGDQVVINHPGNQNHNLIGVIVKEFNGPGDWWVDIGGTNYRYTDAYFSYVIRLPPSIPAPFKVGDAVTVVVSHAPTHPLKWEYRKDCSCLSSWVLEGFHKWHSLQFR